MRILKTVPSKQQLQNSVFVYPTETCYGLGCVATKDKLVERIYRIKNRNKSKPMLWLVLDLVMAEQYGVFSRVAKQLAKKYWPGALTIVVPAKSNPKLTLGMRVSSNLIASQIVSKLAEPVISTSANLAGGVECYTISAVMDQLKNQKDKIDFAIDLGDLPRALPSTIIKAVDNKIEILRQGEIKI